MNKFDEMFDAWFDAATGMAKKAKTALELKELAEGALEMMDARVRASIDDRVGESKEAIHDLQEEQAKDVPEAKPADPVVADFNARFDALMKGEF